MGSWYYICFASCVQLGGPVFSRGKGTGREKRTYYFIEHPEKVELASHKYAILKYFGCVVWVTAMDAVLLNAGCCGCC